MLFAQTSSNQIMFLANTSGYLSWGPRLCSDRILSSVFRSQGRPLHQQACLLGRPMSPASKSAQKDEAGEGPVQGLLQEVRAEEGGLHSHFKPTSMFLLVFSLL